MKTITDRIKARIIRKKRGWVFVPNDFLDIGSRAAIDQVLSRFAKSGLVRRLDRGVYDYPKQSKRLGTLSPDVNDVANAVADRRQVSPSGATAANQLGLSTQVPAKPTFLTNNIKRQCTINGNVITLKPARVPLIQSISRTANLFLQAISYLGRKNIDDLVIARCALILSDKDIKKLFDNRGKLPSWIVDLLHRINDTKHGQVQQTA